MKNKKKNLILLIVSLVLLFGAAVASGIYIASSVKPVNIEAPAPAPLTGDAKTDAENAASAGNLDEAVTILEEEKKKLEDSSAEPAQIAEIEAEAAAYEKIKEDAPTIEPPRPRENSPTGP